MQVKQPIYLSARDAGRLIQACAMQDPDFARKIGEPKAAIDLYASLVAEGCPLTPRAMRHLGLRKQGRGYLWTR
jgi:hypothetical protein